MLPPPPPEADIARRTHLRLGMFRIVALALLSGLIWIAYAHKWTGAEWQVPAGYSGDAKEILARIKIASEGGGLPLTPQRIHRLGAPIDALWNAYPTPEKLLLLALGGIARLTNVFVAANLGLLLGQMLNALAFYWVVRRWLRVRWEWAMAGALLFACNYEAFHRGLSHYSFFLTWVVPLSLVPCWLVARSTRLTSWRSPGTLTCLATGVALGCHNTYYLYFWLPLMGWSLLAQWMGPRRRRNLQVGAATIATALALFFVMNFEYWFYVQSGDAMPLIERNYAGTERYALKPVEMLIPPAFHNWDALAFFGKRYTRWSEWRGEAFLPYLGLTGIAALLWLSAVGIRRLLTRRPPPGEALALAWLVAFASIGGVTNVLSFFGGLNIFRATNRIVIYIAAVLLVFLVVRLSRVTARWRAPWRLAAALGLAFFGVVEQIPRPESAEKRAEWAAKFGNDLTYGRALESAFTPSSMIFQLPVMEFPEVVPPWELTEYEHFRAYLHTDTLRFNYGETKYRPRGRWQQDLAKMPPARLVHELEALGFAGLYINRQGFEDQGESLLKALDQMGYTQRLTGASGQQVTVRLHPAASPRLPLARTMTAGLGWHIQVRDGIRWAYNPSATLLYHNPYDHPVRINLRLTLTTPASISLCQKNHLLAASPDQMDKDEWPVNGITLQPGVNAFELRSTIKPQRAPLGYLRTFGFTFARVEPADL